MTYVPKKKTLLYKRAVFLTPIGKNSLQTLLAASLKKFPSPKERQECPESDDERFHWINYSANKGLKEAGNVMLGCEFIAYTKGAHMGAISLLGDAAHFDVDEVPPPQGKELLDGSVYFGVLENHVIVLQSAAMRTRELERHLNWFLRKAGALAENNQVALEDNVPPETGNLSDAVGIELNAPVHFQAVSGLAPSAPVELGVLKKQQKKTGRAAAANESARIVPVGRAWEAVRSFFGEGFDLPSSMDAEDMLKTGRMRVKLSLLWQNQKGEDAGTFVRNVANKLRHVSDEFDYGINTKSGTIGKDKFKPHQAIEVQWGKVRPNFDDLFPKMVQWLEKLLESERITP